MDGLGTIEVRIRELAQLFNSLDPSPFHERDLDQDAEDYIVGWARELPSDVPLTIIVHLPRDEARKAEERGLGSALANYFVERASMHSMLGVNKFLKGLESKRLVRELARSGDEVLPLSRGRKFVKRSVRIDLMAQLRRSW